VQQQVEYIDRSPEGALHQHAELLNKVRLRLEGRESQQYGGDQQNGERYVIKPFHDVRVIVEFSTTMP